MILDLQGPQDLRARNRVNEVERMPQYFWSPNQFLFLSRIMESNSIPIIDCDEFAEMARSFKNARQGERGLISLELKESEVSFLLELINETSIKYKEAGFVSTIVEQLSINNPDQEEENAA